MSTHVIIDEDGRYWGGALHGWTRDRSQASTYDTSEDAWQCIQYKRKNTCGWESVRVVKE